MSEYTEKVYNFLIAQANAKIEIQDYASALILSDAACMILEQNRNIELLLGVIKAKNE